MTEQTPVRRKPTSLSLDPELVETARQLGVDISRAAEEGIALRAEAARRWREENAEGIRQMNAYVEKHGLPLAKYRMF
jgi:antitoxin CcdA